MEKKNAKIVELSAINTRVRFEQWAHNPECKANTVSAVLNVGMGKVAEQFGYESNKGGSPFAILRGLLFEDDLFKDNAAKLRRGLEQAEVLQAGSSGFEDFRLPRNRGSSVRTLDEALHASGEFLKSLAAVPEKTYPSITSGLTLRLSKGRMIPQATLILDVLTIHPQADSSFLLRVGEIKIFPDRGGQTDPSQLASARAQAGVYKEALEDWIAINGLASQLKVADKGFLVFTWPGSSWPVIRGNEDLREQADRAKRGFKQLDEIASRVVAEDFENYEPNEYLDWVGHSETNYRESCWTFCDLAPRCQDLALAQNRGVILGTEVSRTLGTVQINRAVELMDGALAVTEFEETLKTQLRGADWGAN
jgi:hypothetical protein